MTEIQNYLVAQADRKYRDFTLPLIPNVDPKTFLGVRLPLLKKYAKELSPEVRGAFMDSLPHVYHEENILHAFLLSNMKDYDVFIEHVDAFLPFVSNWSVCDTICNKHLYKHLDQLIEVVYAWLKSKEVYRVRYAVKCLMNYYLGEAFQEEHLRKVAEIQLDDYYVQTMIAWYLATGLAKNYDAFIKAIEEKRFTSSIHNKAIQKAVESYRVSDEHKTYLKTLKSH
ncbi:MAG: DNA alkylation repair protein [Bacilli bacterium]|nr:DNA alkylation repair protein [Bacilli bacterium]